MKNHKQLIHVQISNPKRKYVLFYVYFPNKNRLFAMFRGAVYTNINLIFKMKVIALVLRVYLLYRIE